MERGGGDQAAVMEATQASDVVGPANIFEDDCVWSNSHRIRNPLGWSMKPPRSSARIQSLSS